MGWSDWVSLAVTVLLGVGAIVQAIRYERKGRKTQASVDQLLRDTKDQVDALDPVVTHIDGSVAAVDHNVNQVMDVMTQLYTDVLHITGASASIFLEDRAVGGLGGRGGEGPAGRHALSRGPYPPSPADEWASLEEREGGMGTTIDATRRAGASTDMETYAQSGRTDTVASMTGSDPTSSEARRQVRARLQTQEVGAQVNARFLLDHVPDAALTDVLADLYRLRFARLISWDDVVLTPDTAVIVTGRVPDAA